MPYEFKRSDVYGLASALGAETHERGEELFFPLVPVLQGRRTRQEHVFGQSGKRNVQVLPCRVRGAGASGAARPGLRLPAGV